MTPEQQRLLDKQIEVCLTKTRYLPDKERANSKTCI